MGKAADCDRYNLQQPVHPSRQDCLCRSLRTNGARSPCFHQLTSRSPSSALTFASGSCMDYVFTNKVPGVSFGPLINCRAADLNAAVFTPHEFLAMRLLTG